MSDEWHFALFEFELLLVQAYLFRPVYAVLIPYLQDFIDPIFLLGKNSNCFNALPVTIIPEMSCLSLLVFLFQSH